LHASAVFASSVPQPAAAAAVAMPVLNQQSEQQQAEELAQLEAFAGQQGLKAPQALPYQLGLQDAGPWPFLREAANQLTGQGRWQRQLPRYVLLVL